MPLARLRRQFDSLGGRLLAAFVVVAFSSVVVLTAAALLGTNQGLVSAQRNDRQSAADHTADAAAQAYSRAGGWASADLAPAAAIASAAGAQLTVWDTANTVIFTSRGTGPGRGLGLGNGMHHNGQSGGSQPNSSQTSSPPSSGQTSGSRPSAGSASADTGSTGSGNTGSGSTGSGGTGSIGSGGVTAPVTVAGRQIGSVRLGFGTTVTPGRQVAWSWVIVASLVALAMAMIVAWAVTRWLSRPLGVLAATAQAFARGDRTARANLSVAGEVGAVGAALDHLADQVAQAETVRRHLAADVAHELRTPLAALQAGLEELRDGLVETDPARLAALHDQSLRISRIVDDLAELSAAEAAALSLHRAEADLAELAAQAAAERSAQLRSAGLVITTDLAGPLPVHVDPGRINQAIGNLLSNAARYCRPDDQVMISARAVAGPDGSWAVLEVADTGPGIDPADLPHVFERLRRGRTSHGIAGSGIGLAVVRELVAAHGGTVAASSLPGQGATFTIRLPLYASGHPHQ